MRHTIAVGVDGSEESLGAARYAGAMAQRRRASLTLTHGLLYSAGYGSLGFAAFAPALPTESRDDAQALLDATVAALRADYPDLDIDTVQVAQSGQMALIELSRTADAVVVGHRGLGGFPELLLGSVSAQVVAYAHCPVVVFRPGETTAPDAPIVVGVDGSPESAAAMAFAFDEAAGQHVALEALHVYPDTGEGSLAAEAFLDAALAPWLAEYPQAKVRREVRPVLFLEDTALRFRLGPADNAESVFVDASRHAALVVVGSRGRGELSGLLLGSVSQALVHCAHSPVAVIHSRGTALGAGSSARRGVTRIA
ncbi:universal stress protein [Asanoa sp. NPDC049573]|uniref:universal stress protein n=1 Tax=Asanoa sp. NPDC049573 TaxID=3155396 RepID=UPI00343DAB37